MGSRRDRTGSQAAHGTAESFGSQAAESDEKQLLFTRIFAVSNCVLVLLFLVFVAGVLPRLTNALDKASETLVAVDGALEDFGEVFDNVNSLVDSSSKAVEQTMDKVEQMDIESLNEAISDLNDVVAPMAEFFGRFR